MSDRLSRKSVLINLLGLPLAAAAIASVATQADAAQSPPSAVQYVKKSPNPKKYCKDCRFYVGSATKTGKCTVVSGPIEPKGTCVIWAAKA
ncbi:MAG: hypothetical protein WCE44_13650 [Candidatus Velthaea sp.]